MLFFFFFFFFQAEDGIRDGRVTGVQTCALPIWVRGDTVAAKRNARQRFLEPLLAHLHEAGLGHVSEIADAEAPHRPRGCPFQAWSVGEALRLDQVVLAAASRRGARSTHGALAS